MCLNRSQRRQRGPRRQGDSILTSGGDASAWGVRVLSPPWQIFGSSSPIQARGRCRYVLTALCRGTSANRSGCANSMKGLWPFSQRSGFPPENRACLSSGLPCLFFLSSPTRFLRDFNTDSACYSGFFSVSNSFSCLVMKRTGPTRLRFQSGFSGEEKHARFSWRQFSFPGAGGARRQSAHTNSPRAVCPCETCVS